MQQRFAIYARTATSQENTPNIAMAEQVHQCKEYGLSKGYDFIEETYEEVISGLSQTRPILDKALAAATEGKFDVLVIRDYDRLARSESLFQLLNMLFEHAGVFVEVASEESVNMLLMEHIKRAVADEERRRLSIRRQRGRIKHG